MMKTLREELVGIAISQLGVKESNGEDKYIRWWNKFSASNLPLTSAWCAIFVSWCFAELEARHKEAVEKYGVYLNKSASCTAMWRRNGNNAKTISMGDIVFYDWDSSGDCDHVGIVEKVEGGYLTVIEGNYKDSVARRKIKTNNKSIIHVISVLPMYGASADVALQVLKHAVGKAKFTIAEQKLYDIYGDCNINANNALNLMKNYIKN